MENPEARQWRDAYRAAMQAGSDACPGDEALAALVLGEMGGEERAALARHVTECRRCAESYRTLRALHAEAQRDLPRRRRMRWPAAAAAAVLAAGLGVALVWLGRAPAPTGPSDVLRGEVSLEVAVQPADGAVLAAPPERLVWPAQTGAAAYSARLYDATAEPLWEAAPTSGTEVDLPAAVRAGLASGRAYFWVVEVAGFPARQRLGPYWFELQEHQ